MSALGELLKKATDAGSEDEAMLMAGVLNNDLLAMLQIEGRKAFIASDVLRVNRIMAEYRTMASRPSKTRPILAGPAPLDFK